MSVSKGYEFSIVLPGRAAQCLNDFHLTEDPHAPENNEILGAAASTICDFRSVTMLGMSK